MDSTVFKGNKVTAADSSDSNLTGDTTKEENNCFTTLRYVRFTSLATGLPLFRGQFQLKGFAKFMYLSYVIFMRLHLCFSVYRLYHHFLLSDLTMSQALESLVASVAMTYLLLRNVIIELKRTQLEKYVENLDRLTYFKEGKNDFMKLFKIHYKFPLLVGKILMNFEFFFAVFSFVIAPIFQSTKRSLLPIAHPFEDQLPILSYAYWLFDVLILIYCPPLSFLMDLAFLTFIVFHTAQQEYIKIKLKEVLNDMEKEPKDSGDFKKRFTSWVELHCESLRTIKDAKRVLEPLLTLTYGYNLLTVVLGFFFTVVEGDMDYRQKIIGSGSIFLSFALMGWYCTSVDKLKQQHDEMPQQFDTYNVFESPRWFSFSYKMVSMRSQFPITFSAMGLFNFCCQDYAQVVSGSVSFLATVWNFRNRVLH